MARLVEDSLAGASREADGARCEAGGFSLHAGPRIDANDRKRLERLCRYAGRPALSEARLGQQEDGRIIFHLKRLWSDGTRALLFTPLQLVERLALMVPPPRAHIVTYHGVLSSHSALRAQVAPGAQPEPGPPAAEVYAKQEPAPSAPLSQPAPSTSPMSWAALMQRVFSVDVLKCPRCGHRSEIIATICDSRVIAAILDVWKPSADPF